MTRFGLEYRQVASVVVSAGVAALLTMGYIVYVGRVVGPAEYADFAASLSVVYFIGLALSPLSPAVARLCARFIARGDRDAVAALRRQGVLRVVFWAGAFAVAGAIAAPLAGRALHFRSSAPLVVVFAVLLVFAILNIDRGVLQGLLAFRAYNVNTILEAAGRWVFTLVFFAVRPSAAAAMAGYFAAMFAAELALAIRFHRRWAATPAPVDWAEVKRVTIPLAVLLIAVAAMQNADMLVVKRYFTPAESGAYGAATALARAIGIVFVPLYVMAGPILAGLHESARPIFGTTLRFAALFLGLAAVPLIALAVWPRWIVTILYGSTFAAAGPLLAPLAGAAMLLYTALMLSQALITLEQHRFLIGYGVLAAVQILALGFFHATFFAVFVVLYTVQAATVIMVLLFFVASANKEPAKQPVHDAAGQS